VTLRPWLFTVARRLAIDAARARRARPTEVIVENLELLPQAYDGERFVEAVAMRRQLATLSLQQRRVLVEVFYFGRSAREAAEVLGIPEGTVKSRTHYALRTLRAQMTDERDDRPSDGVARTRRAA
jgi:RNA polymerase sigma-70 factor, ECF subfamily